MFTKENIYSFKNVHALPHRGAAPGDAASGALQGAFFDDGPSQVSCERQPQHLHLGGLYVVVLGADRGRVRDGRDPTLKLPKVLSLQRQAGAGLAKEAVQ